MKRRTIAPEAGASKTASERRAIERIIRFKDLPYNPFRTRLYTVSELMAGFDPKHPGRSLDERIAKHFNGRPKSGRAHPNVHEALAQRIHDHAIDSALYRFAKPAGKPRRKIVGLMGGHSLTREKPLYRTVATLAWSLRQEGYAIVTGGGPGVMEAANLGAYLASYPMDVLNAAVDVLKQAPDYGGHPADYVAAATQVRQRYPKDSGESLAIPTWAYSSEPTGQFSSVIGKYFANSIREDGLLAIAADGVIFAPGTEGTLQEVFQDACHNAYYSFGTRAPMVFLNDQEFFSRPPSIFDVVQSQASRQKPPYANLLSVSMDIPTIVEFIKANAPMPKPGAPAVRTFGQTNLKLV